LTVLSSSDALAASTYSTGYVGRNQEKTYTGISNSANSKTTNNNSWYVIASYMGYTPSNGI